MRRHDADSRLISRVVPQPMQIMTRDEIWRVSRPYNASFGHAPTARRCRHSMPCFTADAAAAQISASAASGDYYFGHAVFADDFKMRAADCSLSAPPSGITLIWQLHFSGHAAFAIAAPDGLAAACHRHFHNRVFIAREAGSAIDGLHCHGHAFLADFHHRRNTEIATPKAYRAHDVSLSIKAIDTLHYARPRFR